MDKSMIDRIPGLREYFDHLPPRVQGRLILSSGEVSTLGEIMQIAEHLRHEAEAEGAPRF